MITHSILAGYSRKSMVSVRHSTERIWKNLLKNEKNSFGFDHNAAILYCDKKAGSRFVAARRGI